MSAVDIILMTAFITLALAVATFFVVRMARAVWLLLKNLLAAMRAMQAQASQATAVLDAVRQEMAFMRQVAQGGIAAVPQETQPPIGRRVEIPPFPTRDFAPYAPDARTEDTDQDLLVQTDQDVMEAQAREEMRDKGMEPDDDSLPRFAVVEEA